MFDAAPMVRLYASASTTSESAATPLLFDVTRSAGSIAQALTVAYTVTGSAGNGTDYAALPGTITIPANQRSATISLVPTNDTIPEGLETVQLTLAPSPAYTTGSLSARTARGRIFDNDYAAVGTNAVANHSPASFAAIGAVTASTVSVTGQSFAQARRATVNSLSANFYDAQLSTPAIANVNAGDVLLLTFFARDVGGTTLNPVRAMAVFELSGGAYTKSLTSEFFLSGGQWRRFEIPFVAATAHGSAGALASHLTFQIGFRLQTIEFGGVSLLNFGTALGLNDLPRTGQTYAGRSGADTAWRDAAEAQIDQLRKRDWIVNVQDTSGRLIDGASVRLNLRNHRFGFGTAVDASTLLNASEPNRSSYRSFLLSNFNKVVLENDLKWDAWANGPSLAGQAITWLKSNGITDIRGHNLVWPSWIYIPASPGNSYGGINYRSNPNKEDSQEEYEAHIAVDGLANAKLWLRSRINTHLNTVAGNSQIRGNLKDWDVVNEPFTSRDVLDIFGDSIMVDWFNQVRGIDPAARLFLNDFPSIAGGAHLDYFINTVQTLLGLGAAIDGLGIQAHQGNATPGISLVQTTLDRLEAIGLPVQITEFDSTNDDPQVQADYLRDLMMLSFSRANVDAFMNWGFWAGQHWLPEAAFVDANWNLRPNGQQWIDLIHTDWTTDATMTTSASGSTPSARCFVGDYEITVSLAGQSFSFARAFDASGTMNLVIPDIVRPAVVGATFEFSTRQAVTVSFDENVLNSLSNSDVQVTNLTTGAILPGTQWALSASNTNGKTTASFVFAPTLPNGNYRATLPALAINDPAGNRPASDTVIDFFVLAGDADRDRTVGFSDLLILANRFGGTGTFEQADFNYDGDVNFNDLLILANAFGRSIVRAAVEKSPRGPSTSFGGSVLA